MNFVSLNRVYFLKGTIDMDLAVTRRPLLPVITMPTSKFRISFTLTVLDAAKLSTHKFILDLGPGNGASGTLGASEAHVAMGHPPAECPSASPSIQSLRCTYPIPQTQSKAGRDGCKVISPSAHQSASDRECSTHHQRLSAPCPRVRFTSSRLRTAWYIEGSVYRSRGSVRR